MRAGLAGRGGNDGGYVLRKLVGWDPMHETIGLSVKCHTDKSAIAEHAWTNDHPINRAKTKIL